MTHAELIEILANVPSWVQRKVTAKVSNILAFAEPYRNQGSAFTFSGNEALDEQVKETLIELSDDVYEEMMREIEDAVAEEDIDAVLLWLSDNKTAQEDLDKYCSHLYYILEGWIAISFAEDISRSKTLTDFLVYHKDPYASPTWQEAFRDGLNYQSGIIREGGYHWGQGTPIDPMSGLTLVEQDIISSAYQYGTVEAFKRMGAIGYKVVRRSTYDCPQCDELTVGIHPLDEIVLPSHPRCVCEAIPVFEE